MAITEDRAVLRVPERMIPVPTSISPEAQAYLAEGRGPMPPQPAVDDIEGWRTAIAATNDMLLAWFRQSGLTSRPGFMTEELSIDGITVYAVTPPGLAPSDDRVYLDPHGGAFAFGGGEVCRGTAFTAAMKMQMRVWSPDYRMPPDHPYPAAVDDCVAVYREVLKEHPADRVVVGGVSAGGNLAAALILRARDEGLPMPAAAVLLTPAMDIGRSGDTVKTNRGVDTVLAGDGDALALYAGGHDTRDPYLSPVYADFSLGFPPTLLASGTRDILLSDTVRTHRALRAAGVQAELHVLEAAPHGFFRGGTPEDRELDREVRRFIAEHCPG